MAGKNCDRCSPIIWKISHVAFATQIRSPSAVFFSSTRIFNFFLFQKLQKTAADPSDCNQGQQQFCVVFANRKNNLNFYDKKRKVYCRVSRVLQKKFKTVAIRSVLNVCDISYCQVNLRAQ